MKKDRLIKSLLAGLFSAITIGALTYLTYKTTFGLFLIASFGSSMVLLYGFPESPFAQPKNIFLGCAKGLSGNPYNKTIDDPNDAIKNKPNVVL